MHTRQIGLRPPRTALMALTVLASLLLLTACSQGKEKLYKMYHERVSSVGDLNDEMVLKYIRTYRELRKNGRNYLQFVSKGEAGQKQGYAEIQKTIKAGGFKDYAEFVKVNAKIAWAWNMSQAKRGMQRQAGLQKWAQSGTDQGIAVIQKHLADPQVPESTKAELRETLRKLQAQKKTLRKTYQKNLKWAEWAMNFTKPLTNDKDMKVIMRHEKALLEVFTGLSKQQLDQVHDHLMKELKIE